MTRKLIIIIAIILAPLLATHAQSRIDKIIDNLEKQRDVETTYTERRTPKKHKLYRISRIQTFSNTKYYDRLLHAFEDERNNTVSALKNATQITYKFSDKNGTSTYTLTRTPPYTLAMSWQSADDNSADDNSCLGHDLPEIRGDYATASIVPADETHFWQIVETRTTLAEQQTLIGREITEISQTMQTLDIHTKKGARQWDKLNRKRKNLQERMVALAQRQAKLATLQASLGATDAGTANTTGSTTDASTYIILN